MWGRICSQFRRRWIGGYGLVALVMIASVGTLADAPSAMAAPPANDNFANATTLPPATSTTITGANADATNEVGENSCCFFHNSVWYRWTAPKTGNYRVELCGSNFNTNLRVSKGTAVNTLETVAENNDDPGCGPDGSRSRLTFVAFAGQRYEVQIGSSTNGATGTISGSIALISPPNDFFADATDLPGSATIGGTNLDGTTEPGEPTTATSRTVWYRWTAPTTADYRLELCGSDFNTYLKVFRGTAVNALEVTAENDDAAGCGPLGDRSAVTFTAAASTLYYIQVGSAAGALPGTIAGSIAAVGSADSDGDGVPDASDACPTVPGSAANGGCKPSNEFAFGRPKLNTKKGTAKQPVEVPGPGQLKLTAKGVKTVEKAVGEGGTVQLPVKPKGKLEDRLQDEGRAKVMLEVSFTPDGGDPNFESRKLKLKEE